MDLKCSSFCFAHEPVTPKKALASKHLTLDIRFVRDVLLLHAGKRQIMTSSNA